MSPAFSTLIILAWVSHPSAMARAAHGPIPKQPDIGGEEPIGQLAPKELTAILERVKAGKARPPESWAAVRMAGDSRDPGFVPILKEIVQLSSREPTLCCNALHALRNLGEPNAYFLGLARNTAARRIALCSIRTLAQDPQEETLAALMGMGEETKDQVIRGLNNSPRL